MAKKETTKAPSTTSSTTVTRISAKDTKQTTAKVPKKEAKEPKTKKEKVKKQNKIGAYFKGAWSELKMVRWPDRPTTWKMTGTLLLFCLFFIVLVLLVDMAFQLLFNQIIG
ncbi:MAG TPA: preprotein translocase subunit SecE [Candidatus Saccharibacteria bacterium]|mgnify:CR=1 FL=1|jgi:preprotein translocase subunit SecE|nr:preprotein translocase subunit SecE [Candidatus Saccharibacteria bacterium]HMR38546.1 preprotein translocase subunit SecE [Candidatus Saccharibacteria bacterium]